jgi:uncharacterized protein
VDATGTIVIFGASARAAAFSALRAGFRPWCADLFADADLRQHAPAMQLPGRYPDGFLDLIDVELAGPWMYTGGLENRPFLVHKMARRRPLLGNDRATLLSARSPFAVTQMLAKARLPAPAVWGPGDRFPVAGRRWLVKPLAGTGGVGIRFLDSRLAGASVRPDRCYLQEFLEGESRSAVFVGDGKSARLIGLTRQLVGKEWLYAAPFRYCGSIGPLPVSSQEHEILERLGGVLAAGCGLRGLFGVDGIWKRGHLWPVEVNPRYTASVEVLEYACSVNALTWHAHVFPANDLLTAPIPSPNTVVGKAVIFAPGSTIFPDTGQWWNIRNTTVDEMPPFADVPPAGTPVQAGHPVLTVFARAGSTNDCEALLQQIAAEVASELFGPE